MMIYHCVSGTFFSSNTKGFDCILVEITDMCDQPCFGKAGLSNRTKNFIYKGQEVDDTLYNNH